MTDHEFLAIVAGIRGINHYEDRPDIWGKGLLNGSVSALRVLSHLTKAEEPMVAGKTGEYVTRAFAVRRFGDIFEPIDFCRRTRGDGGIDLKLAGVTLQIKTRVDAPDLLVKKIDEWGRSLPLCGMAHVFCDWKRDYHVKVLGWIRNRDMEGLPTAPSRRGNWLNWVIPENSLSPMSRLWSEMEVRLAR